MDALGKLTTSEEYIDHYYTELKNGLKARGLQISKVGFVGYFLHIMGFTQADTKNYYDSLFREAFLATASKRENLSLHASVFGYIPLLAQPATLVGSFALNFDAIPPVLGSQQRQIIIESMKVGFNDVIYTLDATYTIVGSICQIKDSTGRVINVPFTSANSSVPIIDLIQYESSEISYTVPYYVYGTYYPRVLTFEEEKGSVSSIRIYIKESKQEEFKEYEVRSVKYFTTSLEEVVFVRFLPNNKVLVELGSGVHGKYTPDCTVKVVVKLTKGAQGNVSQQISSPFEGQVRIYDSGLYGRSMTIGTSSFITVKASYGEGGRNYLEGSDLRMAVLDFVRSRDNLISEHDFYSIIGKYVEDFLLIFKKTHVVDNCINLFMPFNDRYMVPIRSRSISVRHSEFNPSMHCFTYMPNFTLEGVEYVSPFLYIADYVMRYYKAYLLDESVSAYFNTVTVQHDPNSEVEVSPIPIPLSLKLQYYPATDTTKFFALSYEPINNYTLYITIPDIGVYDVCMDVFDDNSFVYNYYNTTDGTGIVYGNLDVTIKVRKDGNLLYTYEVNDIQMVTDLTDILTLRSYDDPIDLLTGDTGGSGFIPTGPGIPPNSYIINIPVMRRSVFDSDPKYYTEKFLSTVSRLNTEENRMISDDVQIRFINTDFVTSNQLKHITVQQHNFNVKFPLILKVNIVASKKYISDNNLNMLNESDLVKLMIGEKLQKEYTGNNISFYYSQIIDIVHNLKWVKHCNIQVFDSSSPRIEIPGPNFEFKDQRYVMNAMTKLEAACFCPVHAWWNLDSTEVVVTFE